MKKQKIISYSIILILLGSLFFPVSATNPHKKEPGMITENAPFLQYSANIDSSIREISYDSPVITGDISEWIEGINEDLVLNYIQGLVDFGPRVTESTACDEAGTYIYEEFEEMGLDVRYQYWDSGYLSGKNIEATLHGTNETSDKIFIVLGHYDSVSGSPGADDNAAGAAAALAAAEILSQYTFNHTIKFLTVDGEEQGLYGSSEYVQEANANGDNIIAALNADMIGYAPNPSDGEKIKIYSNYASEWLFEYVEDIAITYESTIGYFDIIDSGYSSGSDHSSFWNYGYDAIFYHEYNFNDYYHSSSDLITYMNMTYDAKVTQLIGATLAELAEPQGIGAQLSVYPEFISAGSLNINDVSSVTFEIWNSGNDLLEYDIEESSTWLETDPLSGSSSGEHDVITIDIDTTNISIGEYQSIIEIQSNGGTHEFNVYLSVIDANDSIDADQILFDRGYRMMPGWDAAQEFIPSFSTLSRADLYLSKFGTVNGDVTVQICEGGADGTIVTDTVLSADDVPSFPDYKFVTIDLYDIAVIPGETYVIVLKNATGSDTHNCVQWGWCDSYPSGSGGPYDGGWFFFRKEFNPTWSPIRDWDYSFRTFGND